MLNNPTPSLHTRYRCFAATTSRSALLPGIRYSHSLLFTTHAFSFIAPPITGPMYRARSSTVPCQSLDRDRAISTPDTIKAACRLHPLTHPRKPNSPWFWCHLEINDASSMVHFRSSSRTSPATSRGDFSMTLTTTTHSPQQLMVVWNHLLPDESGGTTLISRTALQYREFFFYIQTLVSHSVHTFGSSKKADTTRRV